MMSPDLPRTGRRTSVRRQTVQDEMAGGDKPASTAPRTRRGAARASAIKKMELAFEDGGKQEDHEEILDSQAAQGSPLPRSRRVMARVSESMKLTIEDDDGEKQEGQDKVVVETPAAGTGRRTRAAARGVSKKEDGEKEEEIKTSRYRTRLSSRKQMGEVTVEEVSGRPRTRSTQVSAAIKMVALEQEVEKQEIEVQHGEKAGDVAEEMVSENPIEEEAKIDDEKELLNESSENGEERDDDQENGEESPIRGLVIITKHNDEEKLAEINEPIKQSPGEAMISIENDENPNKKTGMKEEFKIPDPQVSDEVTEETKDYGDHLHENQDLEPEIPAIIGQNLSPSFTNEEEEEDLDLNLNLRLAGITLDESKHSEDDLQVEQAIEIKTSPNRQTNLEIQNEIETLNEEPSSEINDSAAVDDLSFCEIRSSAIETILSTAPSPLLHEMTTTATATTTTTTVSPALSLGDIYRAESENEKEKGLTGLTGGEPKVNVRAEKQNQKMDLHELSLRKLRTLVKESIIQKNNINKVEGKRSALAELNENQL
ncbi:ArsR-like helix-turn-helix domain-containing protein [Dioscorea alata]|nr:ArsR-like helix-turn-helix domain-containing protein [Dioscorea alata]